MFAIMMSINFSNISLLLPSRRFHQFIAHHLFVSSQRHWLVSTEPRLSCSMDMILTRAPPCSPASRSHTHCIHAYSVFIQIFSNMRSYMNPAVLVLVASAVSPVLTAPTRYRYGNLLVEFKGWAFLISGIPLGPLGWISLRPTHLPHTLLRPTQRIAPEAPLRTLSCIHSA
jgi:hypothetical protein